MNAVAQYFLLYVDSPTTQRQLLQPPAGQATG